MEIKKVMIDGVDVSGCEGIDLNLHPLVKCKFLKFKTLDGGIAGIWCSDHTNCYFKQLARKEQKYNLLVKTNEKHVNLLDQLNNKYINLEQECEQKEKELNRHRKAFEDIEKAIAIYSSRHQFSIANDLYNQILDIINKAKKE